MANLLTTDNPTLTVRERKFVNAYLSTAAGNGAKAAELAGYSKGSAKVAAARLMKRPHVRAALERKRERVDARIANRTDIEAADLLTELSAVAFSDVRALFDEAGNLRPIHELPDAPARALAGVEVSRQKITRRTTEEASIQIEDAVVKVKQWDKLRALELIAKLRGLFPSEKVDHTHVFTLEEALDASRGHGT